MAEQKVYALTIKDFGSTAFNLQTRDRIGRKITTLSGWLEEPVYFHSSKDLATGKTLILAECSRTLLDKLCEPAFIESIHEVEPGLKTERSPELQRHFENAAPPPAPTYKNNKPKFGS